MKILQAWVVAALPVIWRDGIVAIQGIAIIRKAPVPYKTQLQELVAAFVHNVLLMPNVRVSWELVHTVKLVLILNTAGTIFVRYVLDLHAVPQVFTTISTLPRIFVVTT